MINEQNVVHRAYWQRGSMTNPLANNESQNEARNSLVNSPIIISRLEFQAVTLAYEEKVILNGVSFKVKPGEMKVILGSSGSGKSTILKLAMGLIKPDEGAILIDGKNIAKADEEELNSIRHHMGMIFQSGALFNSLDVYENIAFRPRELGWSDEKIEAEVIKVLSFVGLLDSAHKLPDELSGGMKRRVAIARAIIDNPTVLFYDEPTAGLDPPTARLICEMAIKLRDINHVTSLFVTHKLDDIRFLSTKYIEDKIESVNNHQASNKITFLVLNEGNIIFDNTSANLWNSEIPFVKQFLYG